MKACLRDDLQVPGMHPAAAGISSAFEMAIRFHLWAQQQKTLTAQAIQKDWNVSRATSFRWLQAYRAATGVAA